MSTILIWFIVAIFVALLFLNIFFRVKTFKIYKALVQAQVDIPIRDIFNEERLRKEVITKYPKHEANILAFSRLIKKSVRIGIFLVVLITLLGAILMYI